MTLQPQSLLPQQDYLYNHIQRTRTFDISSLITACVFEEKPNWDGSWEKYDFSQIFIILDGCGTYITDIAGYPFSPGMMFYRPAHNRSRYEWDTDSARYALISFTCDSPAMKDFGPEPIKLYEEEAATLLDLIHTATRICEPVKESSSYIGMKVKEQVPEVVLSFIYSSLERFLSMTYCRLQKIPLLLDESQKVNRSLDNSRLIIDIKHYLSKNLSRHLAIQEICTYFGVSQSALTKKFRRETNCGIMEYFMNLKIEVAKDKIQKSSQTFTEIAESLGFSSVNYFSRVFKAHTGVTPTEFSRYASKRRAQV